METVRRDGRSLTFATPALQDDVEAGVDVDAVDVRTGVDVLVMMATMVVVM